MEDHDWLARRCEHSRVHLRPVAHRMLGLANDADDAVQETWLKVSRSDTTAVQNMGGWLTTVLARVCLDMLRSLRSRREESLIPETKASVIASVHLRRLCQIHLGTRCLY